MIHPTAIIHIGAVIGEQTDVWSNAVIGFKAIIGERCCIGSNCYIGAYAVIGRGSRLQHGVFLPNHSRLGSDVFIGPNATFTDDRYPRVGNKDYNAEPPVLADGCTVGAGAVVLPGIRIGIDAMVGAGAVVVHDVPDFTRVTGNPARIMRKLESIAKEYSL